MLETDISRNPSWKKLWVRRDSKYKVNEFCYRFNYFSNLLTILLVVDFIPNSHWKIHLLGTFMYVMRRQDKREQELETLDKWSQAYMLRCRMGLAQPWPRSSMIDVWLTAYHGLRCSNKFLAVDGCLSNALGLNSSFESASVGFTHSPPSSCIY